MDVARARRQRVNGRAVPPLDHKAVPGQRGGHRGGVRELVASEQGPQSCAGDALAKCGADLPLPRTDLVASPESVTSGEAVGNIAATLRCPCPIRPVSRLGSREGQRGQHPRLDVRGVVRGEDAARTPTAPPRREPLSRAGHSEIAGEGPRRTGGRSASVEDVLAWRVTRTPRPNATKHSVWTTCCSPCRGRRFAVCVASESGHRALRAELAAFLASTPTASGQPRPTRALNRVMQQAVARARRKGDAPADVEHVLRAIATERHTFAADVLAPNTNQPRLSLQPRAESWGSRTAVPLVIRQPRNRNAYEEAIIMAFEHRHRRRERPRDVLI